MCEEQRRYCVPQDYDGDDGRPAPGSGLPAHEKCAACSHHNRTCNGTPPFDEPCWHCEKHGTPCSVKKARVALEDKCASCTSGRLICDGGDLCGLCIRQGKRCVPKDLKNAPKDTKCTRCAHEQLICSGSSPCENCIKHECTWCVRPNGDGTDTKYATPKCTGTFYDDLHTCRSCQQFNETHFGISKDCNGEIPCNCCNVENKNGHSGGSNVSTSSRCSYDLCHGVRLTLSHAGRDSRIDPSSLRDQGSGGDSSSYHSSDDEDYIPDDENDNDSDKSSDDDDDNDNKFEGLSDDEDHNYETNDTPTQAYSSTTQYILMVTPTALQSINTPQDAITLKQAKQLPDFPQYYEAMKTEYKQLNELDTWEVVDRPTHRKVLSGRWVLRTKQGADGKVEKYKARYCARGFEQVYLLDYNETFATVIKDSSWRSLFALAARFGWEVHQMDFVTAFLNGEVEEEIYVEQPEGFEQGGKSKVLLLRKALYGLKQAPRQWYEKLTDYLLVTGWEVSEFDPSVYLHPKLTILMGVYVDDVLITGPHINSISQAKTKLTQKFKMKDLGRCTYYLGMNIEWLDDGILIHQRNYVDKILKRRQFQGLTPTAIPYNTNELSSISKNQDKSPVGLKEEYQSMTGELLYAALKTRPDISHTVGVLSRYASNPSQFHMDQAIRVYQYLSKTKDTGIFFPYGNQSPLVGFSDSDWATCKDSRKSTSGWIIQLGGATIAYSSKRQRIIAQSTQEAEYVAAAELSNELVWVQRLLTEILTKLGKAELNIGQKRTAIMIDNDSARLLSKNPEHHRVAKHFGIRYHVLRQRVKEGTLHLERVNSKDNTADIFTKALKREDFEKLRDQMGMRSL